jgi:hypothetical protein
VAIAERIMIMINIYAVKLIAYGHSISSPDTMSLSITEFPQDLLLELAKRLDVADLLSFLSVGQRLCVCGHQSR